MSDELQLCLEEPVERLQGAQDEQRTRKGSLKPKQAFSHHSAEHADALLNRLPGNVCLSHLQGLQVN